MAKHLESFFRRVLSSNGFPVIVTLKKGTPAHSIICENLTQFIHKAESYVETCGQLGRDVYFCVSTLEYRSVAGEDNKQHSRVGTNCLETRALILDVDIDESGFLKGNRSKPAIQTRAEAFTVVNAMCDALCIPQPYIINSGYGLHVWWPLQHAIPSEDWFNLAQKLRAICAFYDMRLLADASRITDRTSILRVPDTLNFKNSPAVPVEIMQEPAPGDWVAKYYDDAFTNFISKNHIDIVFANVTPATKGKLVNLDIQDSEKVDFQKMYKSCNWVNQYMKHRHTADYNEWFAMVNISTKCQLNIAAGKSYNGAVLDPLQDTKVEGIELARFVSYTHPEYNDNAVESKYQESINNPGLSARTCDDLRRLNSSRCEGCAFRDLVKTPLSTPRFSKPAEQVIVNTPIIIEGVTVGSDEVKLPKPPFPYEIGQDGGVYKKIKDGETSRITAQVIYEHTLIPVGRVKDEATGTESIELEIKLPHGEAQRFLIPGGMLQDSKNLAKILGDKGVYILPKMMPELIEYIIKYTKTLQISAPTTNNYSSFGWKDVNTSAKFALYDCIITKEGIKGYTNNTHALKKYGPAATAKGSLEEWKRAFAIYEGVDGMEGHICNLMLGFGAPLLHFLDQFGLIFNLYGSGGEGKSSSLMLATSIWGKPDVSFLTMTDTQNAIYAKLGMMNNIPVAFDEITNINPQDLSDFAYNVSTGRTKDALDRNRELKENGLFWQTFILSTSNNSLYGKLSELKSGNNAHGYRILEFSAPKASHIINERMLEMRPIILQNYGHAGRVFIEYVLKNYTEVATKVRKAVSALSDRDQSRERFWIAAQAVIQVAGYITKELGLHNYEPGKLIDFMRSNAPREQVKLITGDPISKLNDYFTQNANNTVRIMDDRLVTLDMDKVNSNIALRIEGRDRVELRGYIPNQSMERWCKANNTDFTWLKGELLREEVIIRMVKKRIGAGTKYFTAAATCWEIDFQHPLITGHAKEYVAPENVVVQMRKEQ